MIIEMRTKRRWILSVLEAVDNTPEARLAKRIPPRQRQERPATSHGEKPFASRLKAATRQLAEAAG